MENIGSLPTEATARLGATPLSGGATQFRVWAPRARRLEVRLVGPPERTVPLAAESDGYFATAVDDVPPGATYWYLLDGQPWPDPASRAQPEGVHGPSQVVDPRFAWHDDDWRGLAAAEYVLYELHVGAFTPAGTLAAAIGELDDLAALGITALELMPLAEFPGTRNWGYDGVFPFAVHHAYGGGDGLKRLVAAAHRRRLAVLLDVVYNHVGPEGNCLGHYGPYFSADNHTPWGHAINFDGPHSTAVRRYFLANALEWLAEYHLDGLRLDATHAMFDASERHFLTELADAVHELSRAGGRRLLLVAESNRNDPALVAPRSAGGLGLDAQWLDDFEHALTAALTGERSSHYVDFGGAEKLATALAQGFVFTGQYSRYRRRRHGAAPADVPPHRLVACAQNHDVVGNRSDGLRLAARVDGPSARLAAAATILSPYVPLLFMGEEYGETAPWYFFTHHGDPQLVDAVRCGRRQAFEEQGWPGEQPDPQQPATFERSRLQRALRHREPHATWWRYYAELLRLRRACPALAAADRRPGDVQSHAGGQLLVHHRRADGAAACLLLHLGADELVLDPSSLGLAGSWRRAFDSADGRWGGPGSQSTERLPAPQLHLGPRAAMLYVRGEHCSTVPAGRQTAAAGSDTVSETDMSERHGRLPSCQQREMSSQK